MQSRDDVRLGVITDADNTLWDTDGVYAAAQLWLLTEVESRTRVRFTGSSRLKYVREIDQSIAKRHHAGLRYPSALLVSALRKVLLGAPVNKAAGESLYGLTSEPDDDLLASTFDQMLKATPPLRPGVAGGLTAIAALGASIVVATEGSVERCRDRLEHWGLSELPNHILSAPKSRELFVRAIKLLRLPSAQCLVIGDQLDRDITYAASAGCTTIYFPGGFSPAWSPAVEDVRPDYVIESFDQVVAILSDKMKQAKLAFK